MRIYRNFAPLNSAQGECTLDAVSPLAGDQALRLLRDAPGEPCRRGGHAAPSVRPAAALP